MFFFGPAAAVFEADLAAQQKKRRISGGEQRAMIPPGLEIWDEEGLWMEGA
jgi:hypothetical protein